MVTRLFDLVNQSFYPEISMAWGAGKRDLFRRLHRVSYQASFWLGIFAVAGLTVVGPWLFEKWTQGKVELDLTLFWCFLVLVVLRSLWMTSFVVPAAINRHQRLTVIYLAASVVGLGCSLLLLGNGLVFAIGGFAIVDIVMIAVVLPRSLSLAQDKAGSFLSSVLPPPSPSAVLALARPGKVVGR